MRSWADLVVEPREKDPPGVHPQRGAIDAKHAWHLQLVIQTAQAYAVTLRAKGRGDAADKLLADLGAAP